jgi:hypothetical protein
MNDIREGCETKGVCFCNFNTCYIKELKEKEAAWAGPAMTLEQKVGLADKLLQAGVLTTAHQFMEVLLTGKAPEPEGSQVEALRPILALPEK